MFYVGDFSESESDSEEESAEEQIADRLPPHKEVQKNSNRPDFAVIYTVVTDHLTKSYLGN